MKVLLINPPNFNMISTNVPEFVDNTVGCYPPLGLMYLASFAEKYTACEIKIVDTQIARLDYDKLEERIRQETPDVVGITTTTFTLIDVILTVKRIKTVDSSIYICLGGPHVNIYPTETLRLTGVNAVVLGEGEYVFSNLLNALERNRDLSKVKNIVYIERGEIIDNSVPEQFINDLDVLPFPARHLVPYKKYYSLLSKKTPITTMITSRGCPYKCIFCDRPHLGKKFRARSTKNVVDEIEECVNIGIKEIFVYDDTFTINKQRVKDICEEILNRRLDIVWDIRARVDTVDEEILMKLKKAGCERIHYGIEAGTQEIIEVLQKDINLEHVKKVFKMTKDLGITTLAYFMLGNPTENAEQIKKTIDFAIQIQPDYVHFAVTTPFPATALYRQGLSLGIWENDYWKEFSENPQKGFIPKVWEENMTRGELLGLIKEAYKKFYIRPRYILNEIKNLETFGELVRKVKAGFKVIWS